MWLGFQDYRRNKRFIEKFINFDSGSWVKNLKFKPKFKSGWLLWRAQLLKQGISQGGRFFYIFQWKKFLFAEGRSQIYIA